MKSPASQAAGLRRRAQARLKARPVARSPQSAAKAARLQHELEVRQIELELQQEDLLAAFTESETVRELYTGLFDYLPVGCFNLAPNGTITLVNLTGARLVGVPRARLLGSRFQFLVAETDRGAVADFLDSVLAGGSPRSVELTLARVAQPPLAVHLEGTHLAERTGCRVVMLDISARRAADEKLRVSDAALKAVSQGVLITGPDQLILSANAAFQTITGYDESAILGRNCRFLQGPLTDRTTVSAMRAALRQPVEFTGEILNYRQDGTPFWNQVTISPVLDGHGRLTHFVGITRDVSAQKHAQEALRASREQLRNFARRLQVIREAERTNVAREIHEALAQELTRLKMDLAWLNRRLIQTVTEPTRQAIRRKLDSMIELSNATFESVLKLATSLRPVVLDSLGLGPAIEWLVEDFQTRTGIAGQARVAKHLPVLDPASATALFRIVQESLTNVIRHAAARHVTVTLAVREAQLSLTVQDDGRGITPEQLADPMSIGLLGLKEHAAVLGGMAHIGPAPDGGTMVRVTTPLPAKPSKT